MASGAELAGQQHDQYQLQPNVRSLDSVFRFTTICLELGRL
jgi:hypothetical protein